MSLDVVRQRTLVAQVKHSGSIRQTHFLGMANVPLANIEEDGPEIDKWYPLKDRTVF